MDIKAVTSGEARTLEEFLTEISFGAPGTIDAQYETLSRLISFRGKVREAIARASDTGGDSDDHASGSRPGE